MSSDIRLVGDVLNMIDGRLIARRPDPFAKRDRVGVGIVNAAAVGNPGDILAVVLPQFLHGELAAILKEHAPAEAGVIAPPGHPLLGLLAHDRLQQ
jgi:hypothetical protein